MRNSPIYRRWLEELVTQAYFDARKNKRGTADEHRFERVALVAISDLVDEILDRKYKPSPGIAFQIEKPVRREIFAAPFRDRVVHHIIYNLTADWWDRQFVYDSFSCRIGKGNLFGVKRLDKHIRQCSLNYTRPAYVAKLDLKGYFMSLRREKIHELAMGGLARQYKKDDREYELIGYLWRQVIFDDPIEGVRIRGDFSKWYDELPPSKSMFRAEEGCGIVIGNLTSQLLSNITLNQLDRFIKFGLGVKYYGRYVDDFYIVMEDKAKLLGLVPKIEYFLDDMGLVLHPDKRVIREMNQGVEMVGAVIYPYRIHAGRRIRNNFYGAAYRLKGDDDIANNEPIVSYRGLVGHYKHHKLIRRIEEKCQVRITKDSE